MLTLLSNLQQIWMNFILGVWINDFIKLHCEMFFIDNLAINSQYIAMFTNCAEDYNASLSLRSTFT